MTTPHRHRFNVTGRQPNGGFRVCGVCANVQVKEHGQWVPLDQASEGARDRWATARGVARAALHPAGLTETTPVCFTSPNMATTEETGDMTDELQERIESEVQDEIASLLAKQAEADKRASAAQIEWHKLDSAGKIEESVKVHARMMRDIHLGTQLSEKLQVLRSPAEVERRIQDRLDRQSTRERLTTMATEKNTKTPKVTAKDQGFPPVYLADNGNFKPGFDAAAKGDLVCAYLGLEKKDKRHTFTVDQAHKLLQARGWMVFVEKKQAALRNAEERKAKAAATKAATAKKSAASKKNGAITEEQVAALDAEHHAEVAARGKGGPDPKPVAKKKSGRGVRK